VDATPNSGPEPSGDEGAQMRRKHVFAINASPPFLDVIRELLQDERYNVTTTNFVPGTFAQVAALQPDLLLIDLVVQTRAGWDLLEQLRREGITSGIPVIVTLTDRHMLEHAEADRARFAGDRYIVKPFDIEDILSTVHDLIGVA